MSSDDRISVSAIDSSGPRKSHTRLVKVGGGDLVRDLDLGTERKRPMAGAHGFFSLTVGFPVWHLGRYRLTRHLARSVSDGLLIQPLGLFLLLAPCRPDSLTVGGGTVLGLKERFEEVKGYGQDDRGVLLRGYLAHRLKQPQLQRRRALKPVCGLPESLRGLVLALGGDDLRPPLSLALGLPSHSPLHVLRDLHILDLYNAHLDAPGFRLLVYDFLELFVYPLPIGQEVVEILLSKNAP